MAGFFTGFATGFANRAVEISQDNERQRNRNIERAMERFAATMERRREELQQREQRRAQAQVVHSTTNGSMPVQDAEGFLSAGIPVDQLMSGRFTPNGSQGQPTVPTTAAVTGTGGGLMSPATPPAGGPVAASSAPQGGSGGPVAPLQDPRDAAATAAPQPAAQAAPTAPAEQPGMLQQVGNAMFGRSPFEGVDQEVQNRYMRETGMQRSEMDRLLAPVPQAPQISGQYSYNQFGPADLARMASSFTNPEGFQRFVQSGGRDTSGLATLAEITAAQERLAQIRSAGRSSQGPRTADFTAAYRQIDAMLEANPNFQRIEDPSNPNGYRIVPRILPNVDTEAMRARQAGARAYADELIDQGMRPAQAARAALQHFGLLGSAQPGNGGQGNPNPSPGNPPPPTVPSPATNRNALGTNRPPQVAPQVRFNGTLHEFLRMDGNTPIYRGPDGQEFRPRQTR
jgi:hypothetical protein